MSARGVTLSVLVFILLIQLSSAAFMIDWNASAVKKTYNLGDSLSGSIVITFTNESLDSEISTNLGSQKTTLKDWLIQAGKKQSIDYNCSLEGCLSKYQAKKSASTLSIFLQQPQVFGFKTSGSKINVTSMEFSMKSNLPASCSKQFSISVIEGGSAAFENYKYTSDLCPGIKQGCFDSTLSSAQYQSANLGTNPYCEKVRLDAAPAYLIGANLIKPSDPKNEKITMRLYNNDFTVNYDSCDVSSLEENTSCVIEYPIPQEGEYGICVETNETGSQHQIRTEFTGLICGTTTLGQTTTRDFDVFARALQYADSPVTFNNEIFSLLNSGKDLSAAANQYLQSEYGGNCVLQDCFIPFTVVGGSQQINFLNSSITYQSDGVSITESNLYEIEKKSPTINSGRLVISLDSTNLKISQKSNIMQLNLGNKTVFKTNISVASVPIIIEPSFALIEVPTLFKIKSNDTITSASWKFGNTITKEGLTATHTFPQAGSYTVELVATTSTGKTYTKTHQVLVGEPRASAEELLMLSRNSLNSVSEDKRTVPSWILPGIENKIDIVALNNSISAIEEKIKYASNDTQFIQIIEELRALNVPQDVGISRTGQFPIIYTYPSINLGYADSIYQTQGSSEQFRQAILEWTREKYDGQIETTTYSASTLDGDQEPILTKVKVTLSQKESGAEIPYLIIDYPLEGLQFIKSYSQREIQSGTYLPLGDEKIIEFYIEDDVNVNDLGIYILPSLEELKSEGYSYEIASSPAEARKGTIYLSIGILLVLVILTAALLQYWYKSNYQRHLFRDDESLFNVMTFIYNSKKKGLKEGDIRKTLLTSGWRREQISYALGRFEGKILGLFGIPIYSARQEEKMKSAIDQRQKQNPGRKVY